VSLSTFYSCTVDDTVMQCFYHALDTSNAVQEAVCVCVNFDIFLTVSDFSQCVYI